VKARGEGLSLPLDQFNVSLTPDATAAPLHMEGAPEESRHWSLCEIPLDPVYVGTLAVRTG
jgi:4'-phosphopantetheinyl transferase